MSRTMASSICSGDGRPADWKALSTSRSEATLITREASCSEHSNG